jgi:hypothetical protein
MTKKRSLLENESCWKPVKQRLEAGATIEARATITE